MKIELTFERILFLMLVFAGSMIVVRFFYSGQYLFFFLIWNLFLAWLPLFISRFFNSLHKAHLIKQLIVLCIWQLLFPNALYVVTDIIHLPAKTTVPVWFDAVLLFSAAVTGLVMAYVSLLRLEVYLQKRFGNAIVNLIIAVVLFLGSFGVYLGRFLRWNSWDIISNPKGLLYQVVHRFVFPFQHERTWGITIMLFAFFWLLWLLIKKMPGAVNRASA